MSKMSVTKGKRGELQISHLLNPILAAVCARHNVNPVWAMARNVSQTQKGGFDLDGNGDESRLGLAWLAIEVKHHAEIKGKLGGWWRQALEQAGDTREPVLIYRGNGVRWRVRLWSLLTIECNKRPNLKGQIALEELSGQMGVKLVVAKKRLKVVADISMDDFLIWFERRVEEEITSRR